MKPILTCLLLIWLTTHSEMVVGQVKTDTLDSFIQQKMKESGIVGLGAAVIVNKEVVWMKGFGYADKDRSLPFTSNTIMNVGSISKTITGACLMKAVEEGKLSLDEDINKYLNFHVENPHFPGEKVTLRQLATHTSSIVDRSKVYEQAYHYGGDASEPLETFLKSYFDREGTRYAKKNFLKKKPGIYRAYSNIAAALAGHIVEVATGEKLNLYSKQNIFEPLKMENTGWFFSEIDLDNHSKLYRKKKEAIVPVERYGLTTYPDGGVRTSVADLSKFFIALLNDGKYKEVSILEEATTTEMLRFQFTSSNKPENINLEEPNKNSGIFWATKRNVTLIGHAGSDPGLRTEMFCDLSKEVGVIVFANTYASPVAIFNELWKLGMDLEGAGEKSQ